MFDPRQTQINESYLNTADTAIKTSRELSKTLINALTKITKVILEKLKEAQKKKKKKQVKLQLKLAKIFTILYLMNLPLVHINGKK
jgi:hypothetical protein